MRLRKNQIQNLSEKILSALQKQGDIVAKVDSATLQNKIEQVITDNFLAEDQLDVEVKKIMDKYRPQIASGQVNEQQIFQMIKKQLIKDRKLVI